MRLAEPVFFSLQWEWPNTWKPSIFVRFFGCNLCCSWCDSKYAVNKPEWILTMTVEEVVKQISEINCKHIIFTWWEPGLFEEDIAKIMNILPPSYTYEIETNGSIPLKLIYDQINISPKLSNSWNKPYPLKTLQNYWQRRMMNYCFKFVAKDSKDCKEILKYITQHWIKADEVFIMPMWTDNDSQINKEVLDFCLKNNFRYCLRTHILLFWNKKWV